MRRSTPSGAGTARGYAKIHGKPWTQRSFRAVATRFGMQFVFGCALGHGARSAHGAGRDLDGSTVGMKATSSEQSGAPRIQAHKAGLFDGSRKRHARMVLASDAPTCSAGGHPPRCGFGRASVEGPWRGAKPREDRPSGAGIRRTMVRTPLRSKALKATLHTDGAGSKGTGNGLTAECDGGCEENARRASVVVTRHGCGGEESFEG